MVEFALAVFSCFPDAVYKADSSLRGLAFRQGGFEIAPLPLDVPHSEKQAFLDAFLVFYKDIARPCVLKSEEVSKYEQHFSLDTIFSARDYYDVYVVARKSCIDCGKTVGQSASSFQNVHAWAHHLFHRTFADLDLNDELSVRDIFDGTKSNHTIKIRRNTSTLLLMRILVAAQLFKLKLISEEELMAGGLVSGLGVFCPTFEALTTRQARILMVTRRLLSRARAILATVFPDLIESIIGPPLPSPLTEKRAEGEPVTVLPPEDLNLTSSTLPEKTMIQQDQLSTITQTFGASPTDLISSATPTPSRAKFRAAVDKILTKKRIEFKEILSQNQKQVESTREALAKRPRDPVLLGILEESRTAQLKIDSSLALIEKVAEEFQALSHLDDLPVMTTYNDDLDLESLPNSPVDLGTAFLAYMTRAKATVGTAEHVRVEKREKREKYRNYNSFVPTDKNGSFTRDMEAAVRRTNSDEQGKSATMIIKNCLHCGRKHNDVSRCRAKTMVCYKCNRVGHLSRCFEESNDMSMTGDLENTQSITQRLETTTSELSVIERYGSSYVVLNYLPGVPNLLPYISPNGHDCSPVNLGAARIIESLAISSYVRIVTESELGLVTESFNTLWKTSSIASPNVFAMISALRPVRTEDFVIVKKQKEATTESVTKTSSTILRKCGQYQRNAL
ncbi:hypothetical protein ACOME3_010414 [Neoechinorhynchus agilis]